MAKKGNAFDEITFGFFDTLTDLEYLSRACDSQTQRARQDSEQAMVDWRQEASAGVSPGGATIGLTSCLSIVNVFGPKGSRFPCGHKGMHDYDLLALLDELGYRAQAQCVSLLYEAFEEFLKRFTPILLFQKRETWKLKSQSRFHNRVPEFAKAERHNTAAYFGEYVRFLTQHNCDDLLAELAERVDGFQTACTTDWFPDLFAVHRVVACIRHTTVHCAGRPSESSLGRLQKWDREMVDKLIRKSVLTSVNVIMPSVTAAGILFEGIAGLAYCLYRTVSESCDMQLREPTR